MTGPVFPGVEASNKWRFLKKIFFSQILFGKTVSFPDRYGPVDRKVDGEIVMAAPKYRSVDSNNQVWWRHLQFSFLFFSLKKCFAVRENAIFEYTVRSLISAGKKAKNNTLRLKNSVSQTCLTWRRSLYIFNSCLIFSLFWDIFPADFLSDFVFPHAVLPDAFQPSPRRHAHLWAGLPERGVLKQLRAKVSVKSRGGVGAGRPWPGPTHGSGQKIITDPTRPGSRNWQFLFLKVRLNDPSFWLGSTRIGSWKFRSAPTSTECEAKTIGNFFGKHWLFC